MTPKEKSIELIDKFHSTEHCPKNHFPNNNFCDHEPMSRYQAIQCVLLFCNEKIEDVKHEPSMWESFRYWENVKLEAENYANEFK